MDGGGRFAATLKPSVSQTDGRRARDRHQASEKYQDSDALLPRAAAARRARDEWAARHPLLRLVHLIERRLPRGFGVGATGFVLAASLVLGVVDGGHLDIMAERARDTRDALANAIGFRIDALTINGRKHLSEDEVLAIAGISARRSLLFVDAADIRARLRANPWIGDATVLKLYPDHLRIDIDENAPFALWQERGRIFVISESGAVLQDQVSQRLGVLPFFVGTGAASRGKDMFAALSRFPRIKDATRAMVLVGERRWNLHLKNGIDVRLPEYDVGRALAVLDRLAQDKHVLTRDITAIDLRLPDRVSVRLSDAAFAARQAAREDAAKAARRARAGDA